MSILPVCEEGHWSLVSMLIGHWSHTGWLNYNIIDDAWKWEKQHVLVKASNILIWIFINIDVALSLRHSLCIIESNAASSVACNLIFYLHSWPTVSRLCGPSRSDWHLFSMMIQSYWFHKTKTLFDWAFSMFPMTVAKWRWVEHCFSVRTWFQVVEDRKKPLSGKVAVRFAHLTCLGRDTVYFFRGQDLVRALSS